MNLTRELSDLAFGLVDLFGVADLSRAESTIREQGGEIVSGYPVAISIGICLPGPIVDRLPDRSQRAVRVRYRQHADIIDRRLGEASSRISAYLQNLGFDAFVPASKKVDDERICAIFSHKMAAHLAGLGWIGKSCLLITPDRGPRVRWATILTTAKLEPTAQKIEKKCGSCQLCVDVCPVRAFTGREFSETEPRESRYDARKCEQYLKSLDDSDGRGVCGLCLFVCPYGRR